jgi:hypothetical protein
VIVVATAALAADAPAETARHPAVASADQHFDQLTLIGSVANPDDAESDTNEPKPPVNSPPQPPHGGGDGDHEPTHGPPQSGGVQPAGLPPVHSFDPVAKTRITLGNDPLVAVGENYIVATESHTIAFYDKSTGVEVKPKTTNGPSLLHACKKKAAGICMADFFAPFLAPFLDDACGNPDLRRPNPEDVNRHLNDPATYVHGDPSLAPLICDPDNPIEAGCVNEAYDTRVLYEEQHRRFWVQSHLRNKLYGGGEESRNHINVPEESRLQQRFVAVAVSIDENPVHGFHEFLLAEHPGDWPTMAVHGRFLVVGAKGRKRVFLFDAKLLRAGTDLNGVVSLGTYDNSDFDSDEIWPVVQHDERHSKPFIPTLPASPDGSEDVPTFLVGVGGNKVTIYAFDEPSVLLDQPGRGFIRPSLMSSTVELNRDLGDVRNNPVYRDGFIYIAAQQCVSGDGRTCNHQLRIVRIPVFRMKLPGSGNPVMASSDHDLGFQSYVFGGENPQYNSLPSYEVPAIEVNKNDDVVVVYGRTELNVFDAARPPGAYFAISYHDKRGLLMDGVLAQRDCKGGAWIACLHTGPDASHLDLPGISLDPVDDTTVWMAHGFVDSDGLYRMVVGRVKP